MQYFGLIFTNHALKKMGERGIRREDVWETFRQPGSEQKGKQRDVFEFRRKFENFELALVAKQNEKNEWIVLSVWRNPPLPGTSDAKNAKDWIKYRKSGFWGKILIIAKQQLGF